MSFGKRPVASFLKRAVYKTEFDIFKQNTEIDLISLASLEDDNKETEFLARRCAKQDAATKISVRNSDQAKRKPFTRTTPARFLSKTEHSEPFKRKPSGRTCKSAISTQTRVNLNNQVRARCQTTCGVRRNQSSDLSSLNKRNWANVDFKYDKTTPRVNIIQPKSAVNRYQVKSAFARPRSEYSNDTRRNPTVSKKPQSARTRLKSAGCNDRQRQNLQLQRPTSVFKDKRLDCVVKSDKQIIEAERNKNREKITHVQITDVDDVDGENAGRNKVKFGDLIDSDDSGVVNDFATSIKDASPFYWKVNPEEDNDVIDSFSVYSNTSRSSQSPLNEPSLESPVNSPVNESSRSIAQDAHFDVNDLIRNLEEYENSENLNKLADYDSNEVHSAVESDVDSIFSLSESSVEAYNTEEILEADSIKEEPGFKSVPDVQDITMSKEAKSVIIETLHDLRGKRIKNDKENYEDNIRFKSVNTQKRIKENRNKYDQFMRERTATLLQFNEPNKNDNKGSNNDRDFGADSSDCDEIIHLESDKYKKFFPTIGETAKIGSNTSSSICSKRIYSLEQAKRRKYKIPGIGNYDLVTSPDNDFEITPLGFDCRYNVRPLLTKEELDPPPKFIQEKSIQKCKKWLRKVNLSPLSLNPVLNKK